MGDGGSREEDAFPWHIGVYDSHCHPTDALDSLESVPRMRTRALTIMATREEDQRLVSGAAVKYGVDISKLDSASDNESVPCQILPAFGWHPWFSHYMYDDTTESGPKSKFEHYRSVLNPPPEDEKFIDELVEPLSLKSYLGRTREYLEKHPHALIGEVGMDRAMRIPENTTEGRTVDPEPGLTPGGRANKRLSPYRINIEHQQKVLLAQLRLAGEMGRAVSVHGVSAHGFLHDTLALTWKGHEKKKKKKKEKFSAQERKHIHPEDVKEDKEVGPKPYPPRICLHSYSGPPETVKQYLKKGIPVVIFFSFSQVINFAHGSNKAVESIKAIPANRILIESDLHRAGDRMEGLLADIAKLVCEVKGWSLEGGLKQLATNWKHFALGIEPGQEQGN